MIIYTFKPLGYTNWGQWTQCTELCGGGIKKRQRFCYFGKELVKRLYVCMENGFTDVVEKENCNERPCKGGQL